MRLILVNFTRKCQKMIIKWVGLSASYLWPPIHFKCAYILFGTCCKYNNLSRAHLFHVYQNSSSHTLMNFNSFSIQSYPQDKQPAQIKPTRLVKKSDKFRVHWIGRYGWPEIYDGRQPNGQCDHNNVISVSLSFLTKNIKIEDFLINNYDDG